MTFNIAINIMTIRITRNNAMKRIVQVKPAIRTLNLIPNNWNITSSMKKSINATIKQQIIINPKAKFWIKEVFMLSVLFIMESRVTYFYFDWFLDRTFSNYNSYILDTLLRAG